ncbi:hypothetical protein ACOME3_005039 [Neoechinorhynchus agilis]
MARHAELNNIISRTLHSLNVLTLLEPNHLCRSDGKRPDGMTIFPWKEGKCLIWDATCVDSLAPSSRSDAISGPGGAATAAERRKTAKYAELEKTHLFLPFGVETNGAFGVSAKKFCAEIGRLLIKASGDHRQRNYLIQRLSVAIQRGNTASVITTAQWSGAE